MNEIAYFEIQSNNPEREAAFYHEVFGWEIVKDDAMPIPYYRITTGSIQGAILSRPAAVTPMSGTNAFTCSVQVEGFDATAAKIIALGGQEALPKFAVPGRCWQGYFLDPDGTVFGIFEADENASGDTVL
ncbi:MAG: VOC family protein [Syntrophomonadaceae bacterium]|jgi:predicted enzyme related to lactoylglutathione lyase|nr:VOC family protein [Syntrophomonadaceae bacterium]